MTLLLIGLAGTFLAFVAGAQHQLTGLGGLRLRTRLKPPLQVTLGARSRAETSPWPLMPERRPGALRTVTMRFG